LSAIFNFSSENGIVLCDYGSSQGKNSSIVFADVLKEFRTQIGESIPISIFHEDIPENDWSTLFKTSNKKTYGDNNVFVFGIGTSFLEHVFPPRSIHIAWTAVAIHYLSHVPCLSPYHILPQLNPPEILEKWEKLAAVEWEQMVKARSIELKPGGRFIVVSIASHKHKILLLELWEVLNSILKSFVQEGSMDAEEYLHINIVGYTRTIEELEAPLSKYGFHVDHIEELEVEDPYIKAYRQTGDKEQLQKDHTNFVRSFSESMIISQLNTKYTPEVKIQFVDKLFGKLGDWIVQHCDEPSFDNFMVTTYKLLLLSKSK